MVLQLIGLGMIIGAAFTYDNLTRFPGLAALVPCLGTALIIASSDRTSWVTRALGHPTVVSIGLVSYPLYLWHWPILELSKLTLLRELRPFEIAALYGVAGVLSAATWHYVEKRFRARPPLR